MVERKDVVRFSQLFYIMLQIIYVANRSFFFKKIPFIYKRRTIKLIPPKFTVTCFGLFVYLLVCLYILLEM